MGRKGETGIAGPPGKQGPAGQTGTVTVNGPVEVTIDGKVRLKEEEKGVGYPPFKALVYSFDVFVPMIDFGQGEYWVPGKPRSVYVGEPDDYRNGVELEKSHFIPNWNSTEFLMRCLWIWYWLQIGLGWLLTTILLASVAGFLEKKE